MSPTKYCTDLKEVTYVVLCTYEICMISKFANVVLRSPVGTNDVEQGGE